MMKKQKLIFFALIVTLVPSATGVQALSCDVVTESECTDTILLRLSSNFNAHAEQHDQSNYNYVLCCTDDTVNIFAETGSACDPEDQLSALILNLSSPTNAHAENDYLHGDYGNPVCLSTDAGKPVCTLVPDNEPCPTIGTDATPVCLLKLSAATNAHVGDCDSTYTNRICCRVNRKPLVNDITPPPPLNLRGTIDFTADASDPDPADDPPHKVHYIVSYNGGVDRDLGEALQVTMPPTWPKQWDSTQQINPYGPNPVDNTVKIRARAFAGSEWGDWFEYPQTMTVDNTPPSAEIDCPTDNMDAVRPDLWAGLIFDISWVSNTHCDQVEIRHGDASEFGTWSSGSPDTIPCDAAPYEIDVSTDYMPGANPDYCYGLKALDTDDGIDGLETCTSPDLANCNCTKIDSSPPSVSGVQSSPPYTSDEYFDVSWNGNDDESGIRCYQVEYRVEDGPDPTPDWVPWSDLYDDNAQVVQGSSCVPVPCTKDLDGATFDQRHPSIGRDGQDGQTYYFRARAIDDVDYGCSNIGPWVEDSVGTVIDKTPPTIQVKAYDVLGDLIPSPDGNVTTETPVNFTITHGPDYTGVQDFGLIYQKRRIGSGYPVGNPVKKPCDISENPCTIKETWYDDYNITYKAYAEDMTGNRAETPEYSFTVFRPFGLSTLSTNVFMSLGSYEIVPIVVANRQKIAESASIALMDDYTLSKFVDISEGELSEDNRTLNITLQPKQTKTIHVLISTSDIGDNMLTIVANSTRSPEAAAEITDTLILDISVAFPPDFSGLSYASVAALTAIAVMLYSVLERRKR